MKKLALLIIVLALAACESEEQGELKIWMRDQAKNMKGRVPPLPPVKSYTAFDYAANELPDPFRPSKIEPDQSHVTLKELVQDAGGDWTERTSSLQLNEEAAKK